MANDSMRSKAAAIFGKEFMNVVKGNNPSGNQVNSAQALQKRANARPIPVYKDGGVISSRVATRAAAAGYKKGGKCKDSKGTQTSADTARKLANEMGGLKLAEGGDASKQARLNRKIADIESDYQKALKGGKNEGVAKAKYEQRIADAQDDFAKWTGADRSATSAAEKAAEASLSEARRTKGMSIRERDMKAAPRAAVDKVAQAMDNVRSGVPAEIKVPEAKLVKPAAAVAAPVRKVAPAPRPAVVKTEAASVRPAVAQQAPAARGTAPQQGALVQRTPAAIAVDKSSADYNTPEARRERLGNVFGIKSDRQKAAEAATAEAARQAQIDAARAKGVWLKDGGKPVKRAIGGTGKERKGMLKKKDGGGISTRPTTPSGRRATDEELRRGQVLSQNRDTRGMTAAQIKAAGEAVARGNREEYEPTPTTGPTARRPQLGAAGKKGYAKGGAAKVRKGMMSQKGDILKAVKPKKGIGGIM